MQSILLAIIVKIQSPRPADNPIVQAQTIAHRASGRIDQNPRAFVPDYNPPPVITNSSGTR
jgi:hypothetical protein